MVTWAGGWFGLVWLVWLVDCCWVVYKACLSQFIIFAFGFCGAINNAFNDADTLIQNTKDARMGEQTRHTHTHARTCTRTHACARLYHPACSWVSLYAVDYQHRHRQTPPPPDTTWQAAMRGTLTILPPGRLIQQRRVRRRIA